MPPMRGSSSTWSTITLPARKWKSAASTSAAASGWPRSIRFRNVVDKYQTTSHAPEALYRLTESYLALGVPEEAKKCAAVLGANYPGSEWYERAYELMQKNAPEHGR